MSSKRTNDIEKECQICGGLIWGRGVKVIIEGAKITVCQNCAQHGKKIVKKTPAIPQRKVEPYNKTTKSKPIKSRIEPQSELEIVVDYTTKIREVRQSMGLNQDQFAQKLNEKPSLLKRIETGKAKPSIKLAKKIEKVYGIKLITKSETIDTSAQVSKYMKKSSGTSLGDIAFVKKKK